jgi:hypothetical protein
MPDVSSIGNDWLERMRIAWLSVNVTVTLSNGTTLNGIPATVSATTRNVMDSNGAFISTQFRAFLISREDLPDPPARGLRITLTEKGRTMIYEAAPPSDGEPVWQWSDRTQALRKIHTIPVG